MKRIIIFAIILMTIIRLFAIEGQTLPINQAKDGDWIIYSKANRDSMARDSVGSVVGRRFQDSLAQEIVVIPNQLQVHDSLHIGSATIWNNNGNLLTDLNFGTAGNLSIEGSITTTAGLVSGYNVYAANDISAEFVNATDTLQIGSSSDVANIHIEGSAQVGSDIMHISEAKVRIDNGYLQLVDANTAITGEDNILYLEGSQVWMYNVDTCKVDGDLQVGETLSFTDTTKSQLLFRGYQDRVIGSMFAYPNISTYSGLEVTNAYHNGTDWYLDKAGRPFCLFINESDSSYGFWKGNYQSSAGAITGWDEVANINFITGAGNFDGNVTTGGYFVMPNGGYFENDHADTVRVNEANFKTEGNLYVQGDATIDGKASLNNGFSIVPTSATETTLSGSDKVYVRSQLIPNPYYSTSPTSTIIGEGAGKEGMSGDNNVVMGYQAGSALTGSSNNTFFGYQSGRSTTGSSNTFIGFQAGNSTVAATTNIGVGLLAGFRMNGSKNIGIGDRAMYGASSNATGTLNIAMGERALFSMSTGSNNIGIGYYAGNSNTTGYYNTFNGYAAGRSNTTGSFNIALGDSAGYSNTIGNKNIFLGHKSGGNNTTGNRNIFIGDYRGYTSADSMLYIDNTGKDSTATPLITGNMTAGVANRGVTVDGKVSLNNSFSIVPTSATETTLSGSDKVYVRSQLIPNPYYSTSPTSTIIGEDAGKTDMTGGDNVFVGREAGYSNTTGSYNTFNGAYAGRSNTTGYHNIFSGSLSGRSNTTGSHNTFSGYAAGYSNTTGSYNTFNGRTAGRSNTTGSYNTFKGYAAGYSNTTGYYNIALGDSAGYNMTEGNKNIFLGHKSGGNNTTGNRNIFIGDYLGYTSADSMIYIDNTGKDSTATPLITGNMTAGVENRGVTIDGNLIVNGTVTADSAKTIIGKILYSDETPIAPVLAGDDTYTRFDTVLNFVINTNGNFNKTSKSLVCAVRGFYDVICSASIGCDQGSAEVHFGIAKNGTVMPYAQTEYTAKDAGDVMSVTIPNMPWLEVGDSLFVMGKSDSQGDSLRLKHLNFIITKH